MNDDQLIKMNFDMAKKYYDCALSYSTNTEIDFVFDPFIVNLSFSCELSLKTIIYYEKIYAPEQIKQANHNLKTLFYMLGKNTRTNIEERIKQNNYRFDMEIKRAAI